RLHGGMLSWLARNGRTGVPALAGGKPRGRKSRCRHCGKAIEALPSCGQIKPSRGRARRAPDSLMGEDMANMARARGRVQWAKEQKPWRTERRSQLSGTLPRRSRRRHGFVDPRPSLPPGRSAPEKGDRVIAIRPADPASAGTPPTEDNDEARPQ